MEAYDRVLFEKATGKYVINSRDLAYSTNRRVHDIEWFINKHRNALEEFKRLTWIESEYGTKYHNLSSIQLFTLLKKEPMLECEETKVMQITLAAAAQDDRELAGKLAARAFILGINFIGDE